MIEFIYALALLKSKYFCFKSLPWHFMVERSLINKKGLPRRSWYKHQVYAPGYYTGYGVKTLPGIREGIEERNWKEAQENIEIVSKTIEVYTKEIQKAPGVIMKKAF